jgi:hypothetical protein
VIGVELPRQQTIATPLEMRHALRLAWFALFNDDPSKETLSLLLSQWALETGRGKACYCWNYGNEKYPSKVVAGDETIQLGSRGDYFFNRCNEKLKGKWIWFDKPQRGACFKGYGSIFLGALAYLGLLARRYRGAWNALCSGNPSVFVRKLKEQGYFTADMAPYEAAVVSLFREFQRLPDPIPVDQAGTEIVGEFDYHQLLALVRADMTAECDREIWSDD